MAFDWLAFMLHRSAYVLRRFRLFWTYAEACIVLLLIDNRVTVDESSTPSSRSLAYLKCRKSGGGASRCFLGLTLIVKYFVWLKVESDTRMNTIIEGLLFKRRRKGVCEI